ncbi:unnamed protein product [Litomosoides sigmodontis]|uniref:Uncharacterized protein n=1 Tax=Litomosoides sigmodontis TaxID=42156 RepID=A0A3P6T9I9_LITSI|nr:unnamed protein product [Litomosoides sigmodontis]
MKTRRPAVGKRGKRYKNPTKIWNCSQNHVNLEKLGPANVELQKWRSNRVNYLKPSLVNVGRSADEKGEDEDGLPTTSATVAHSRSPLQMDEVSLSFKSFKFQRTGEDFSKEVSK